MQKIFIVFFLAFVVIVGKSYAQKPAAYEADDAFNNLKYYDAIELYKKAYTKVGKNKMEKLRILFQIAECYRLTNDVKKAEAQYKKVIASKYPDPIAILYYANSLRDQEKYDLALEQYKLYQQKVPEDPRGKLGAESCEQAVQWLQNKTRYEIENVKKINSPFDDYAPSYADYKKYRSLVFVSTREGSLGKGYDPNSGQMFSDIYFTSLDNKNNWSAPVLFDDQIICSENNEGPTVFNLKVNTMYFTRCLVEKKKKHGCQIYVSEKAGKSWSQPEMLNLANDTFAVGHPSITKSEKELYFASNIPGGQGSKDIWVARRSKKNKPFGKPENLGKVINTPGNEMFPFIREYNDGRIALYFSSDGHVGLGGLDIFRSELINGQWTEPENMKVPINSSGDDFGIIFEGDKETGFFTSNRKGGRGGDDIYWFNLPPLLYTLTGTVRDDNTLQLLTGALVKLTGTDKSSLETKTDAKGVYKFNNQQIKENTTYYLEVSKKGYFGEKGTITTVGLVESKDFVLDFNLVPIPVDPIPLPEIRYDLAQWVLKDQYKDSLNGLYATLIKNPTIVIELGSHTDFRADALYNDSLSFKRARSVVEYLISKGIDADRMVPKGYGERVPRKLDKDITFTEGEYKGVSFPKGTVLTEDFINGLKTTKEKEAAHQLNRRTEFRIIRDDYVPKNQNDSVKGPAQVNIVVNPEDNIVNLSKASGDTIIGPCVVMGIRMNFHFREKQDTMSISAREVRTFFSQQKLGKSDFVRKEAAFNADGSVIDGEVVILKQVAIGTRVVKNIPAKVRTEQKEQIILGDKTMLEFGAYDFDMVENQLIFE